MSTEIGEISFDLKNKYDDCMRFRVKGFPTTGESLESFMERYYPERWSLIQSVKMEQVSISYTDPDPWMTDIEELKTFVNMSLERVVMDVPEGMTYVEYQKVYAIAWDYGWFCPMQSDEEAMWFDCMSTEDANQLEKRIAGLELEHPITIYRYDYKKEE